MLFNSHEAFHRRDAQNLQRDMALNSWLTETKRHLDAGALDKFSVPAQEQAEVKAIVMTTRGDIVTV